MAITPRSTPRYEPAVAWWLPSAAHETSGWPLRVAPGHASTVCAPPRRNPCCASMSGPSPHHRRPGKGHAGPTRVSGTWGRGLFHQRRLDLTHRTRPSRNKEETKEQAARHDPYQRPTKCTDITRDRR